MLDLGAWPGRVTREGETCELPGFGVVTPQVVLDLMDGAYPFIMATVRAVRPMTLQPSVVNG